MSAIPELRSLAVESYNSLEEGDRQSMHEIFRKLSTSRGVTRKFDFSQDPSLFDITVDIICTSPAVLSSF